MGLWRLEMARFPFSWVVDPDAKADLLYDLARELVDVEELECLEDRSPPAGSDRPGPSCFHPRTA